MPIIRPITKTTISTTGWGIPITDEVNRLTTLTAPTAWTTVTFQNGWNSAGAMIVKIRKIGDMVQIRGAVSGGSLPSVIFTLPVGFRPVQETYYPTGAWSGAAWVVARVIIQPSGTVSAQEGANQFLSLDGMSFSITA